MRVKCFVCLFLLLFGVVDVYAEDSSDMQHDHKVGGSFDLSTKKVILKYTDTGLDTAKLVLDKLDSSVFFINMSEDKSINLDIDFGDRKIHCHSKNLVFKEGHILTSKPISPRNFEVLCFPGSGTYPFLVKEAGGKITKGEVVVNE